MASEGDMPTAMTTPARSGAEALSWSVTSGAVAPQRRASESRARHGDQPRPAPPAPVALARPGGAARELAARAGHARASMSLDVYSRVVIDGDDEWVPPR
jgi:hypothetical protein